jgi:hypothetical protein
MSEEYESQTRDDLREEAERRDLSTSGTKQEIIDRLVADDEEQEQGPQSSGSSSGKGKRTPSMQLARRAAVQLGQLTGKKVDGVSGFAQTDEGWRVILDVIEAARVPSSSDVLGSYEVIVDGDGDLIAYERVGRYVRGATSREE